MSDQPLIVSNQTHIMIGEQPTIEESEPTCPDERQSLSAPDISKSTRQKEKHLLFGPCNCRMTCNDKIPDQRRQTIHDAF